MPLIEIDTWHYFFSENVSAVLQVYSLGLREVKRLGSYVTEIVFCYECQEIQVILI
jgi:hypothetical protein